MLSPLHDAAFGTLTVKYNKNAQMPRKDPFARVNTPARERIQITSKITHITHCASCANGTILPTLLPPHKKKTPQPHLPHLTHPLQHRMSVTVVDLKMPSPPHLSVDA